MEPPEEPVEEPPPPEAPPPVEIEGSGAKVVEVTLQADAPLVVTGRHSGGSNFVVELIPDEGTQVDDFFAGLLFNEIGQFSGQVANDEVGSGGYRVDVSADGPWSLRFAQPVPNPKAKAVPASFSATGAKVKQLRVESDVQPSVAATHQGRSNFVVQLIPMEDVEGQDLFFFGLVFNEIGSFEGETVTDSPLAPGTYLVYVQADGSWTLEFSS